MSQPKPPRRWPAHVAHYLRTAAIDADDRLDAARRRLHVRLGLQQPRHIAAYRAYDDGNVVELSGRVLAQPPLGGPGERDDWWDNLLNTYRRFESDEVPDVRLRVRFRNAECEVTSDHEGYYSARLQPATPASDCLWDNACVSLADGTLLTPQPVLQVASSAKLGIVSDIDDTVLHSSITDWKTAAQLTFLHNARTRKPLAGVAALYAALQLGADKAGRNPLFYVSSSPWNLYDLLEDFLELNAIPCGPIFLRDLGLDTDKFIKTAGHGHKLERARALIRRMPQLRWVLLGDSGQADAELYAEAAREFGDRIAAIYIRDVDPDRDSPLDIGVDAHITAVAGTRVPMLRVRDSLAAAEHAASLGLLAADTLPAIAREVGRDFARPTLGEAAADAAAETPLMGNDTPT
jgi:phosphatidate phosphatase APP1